MPASSTLQTPTTRLVIRPVTIGLVQGDLAVVDSGIEPGERIVVSDLIPAVAGMLLTPRPTMNCWQGSKSKRLAG